MESDQNNDMTVPVPPEPPKPEVFTPPPDSVVEVPNYASKPLQGEPVLANEVPHYNSGEVVSPPAKKDNKKIWIIVVIVILLLCCCCTLIVFFGYRQFNNVDINDFQDLLNQYNSFIQLGAALI